MKFECARRLPRWFILAAAACWLGTVVHAATGLEWDAVEKTHMSTGNEDEATFVFSVTNRTEDGIQIRDTTTSCSCTVAAPPRDPWIIEAGATETLTVVVDLRNRGGTLTKTIYVDTSAGDEQLRVHVQIPPPPEARRAMNLTLASADRQAVLRGDCASCHVAPTVGKKGAELFQTACVICHAAEHRASMVPDLMAAKVTRDAAYWEKWIREGGEGTLMPAFAKTHGGPLDEEQVASLIAYLVEHLPRDPAGAGE